MSSFKIDDEVRIKSSKDLEAALELKLISPSDIGYLRGRANEYYTIISVKIKGDVVWHDVVSNLNQSSYSFRECEIELTEPTIDISLV